MTNDALNIDLLINISNSKVTTVVKRVSDSMGTDRTAEFQQFCSANSLPLSLQGEIADAALEFVKVHPTSLP